MQLIQLSCGSCGAKLEITGDIDRFACAYCGSEWIVSRSGGTVSLKAVEESLDKIRKSSRSTERNTEILAGEVKLKKLRELIRYLNAEKTRINLNPVKENPQYKEVKKEGGTKKAFGCLGLLLFFAVMNSMMDATAGIRNDTAAAIVFFVPAILLILFLIPLSNNPTVPEFVDDFEAKRRNKERYAKLEGEIRKLERQAREIEENILWG